MLAFRTGWVEFSSVSMGQRIITLIMLLAWVPANCHCLLGALIKDATANSCCIESHQKEPAHGQGESDCCDLCGAIESGKFRAPSKDYIDFGSVLELVIAHSAINLPVLPVIEKEIFIPKKTPPESAIWQFLTRTAYVGRSPSLLS